MASNKRSQNFIGFKVLLTLLFIIPVAMQSIAQNQSNKGTEFWLGYMAHEEGTTAKMSLYITSDSSTTGTVSIPGQGWSTNYSVTANSLTVVDVPANSAYMNCSDCIRSRAVKVTAQKKVVVYSHHYMDNQSDATLVLPTTTQGKEYRVMAFEQSSSGNSGRSTFIIVAHKDNTSINITPTIDLLGSSGTKAANTMYNITLDEGEVYQAWGRYGTSAYDVSGTHIQVIDTGSSANCRTVAVFSGSSYTRIGGCPSSGFSFNSGDNLYEQMFPIKSWGKEFACIPALGRTSGDNFRICASEDNTTVRIFPSQGVPGGPTSVSLDAGEYYTALDVTSAKYIDANKPVMMTQFQKTARCDGGGNREGDPSMTVLNPLEQTLQDITVYSSSDYDIDNHYINVVIPSYATGSFRIDGSAINASNWSTVPWKTNYSYTRIAVSSGNHRLVANAGFIATAYGEGRYESYGYAAGANVKDLTATIGVANSPKTTELSGCLGTETQFRGNAEYAVTQWAWDFGDGDTSSAQNPSHTYADTGTYKVRLYTYKSIFDGCSVYDSTFVDVTIYDVPTALFGTTPLCDSLNVQFTDTSIIPSPEQQIYTRWTLTDGKTSAVKYGASVSHLFDSVGTFEFEMVIGTNNQCRDTFSDSLTIHPNPLAGYTTDEVCFYDSSYFINTSTVITGSIDSFEYEFSDGDGSLESDPVHMFNSGGWYYTTLSVKTDQGCTASYFDSLYKHDEFDVSFTYNDTCFGNGNSFINTSFINGGAFTDTTWYTSEPDTASTYNFSKTFNGNGTYDVMLVMEQDSFCSDTFMQTITIHPLVAPDFTVTGKCANDSTTFTDISTISTGSYTIAWNLDDGFTSTTSPVKVQYATQGSKDITLTTTTDQGCITDTTMTIDITNPEILSFNLQPQCLNEVQEISPNLSLGLDSFSTYFWDVDNTVTYIDSSFSYLPLSSGVKYVELTATTKNGCSLYHLDSFTVFDVPTSDFTIADVCLNETILPINSSTTPTGTTIDITTWSVNGTQVSTMTNPSLPGTPAGIKTVQLISESNIGCKDTIEKQVQVFELPSVNFGVTNQCFGESTVFTDASTVGDGTISNISWSFDGNTSTGSSASYVFSSPLIYVVKEIVESSNGCIDSLTQPIEVYPLPTIDVAINDADGCAPYAVDLTNNSSIASGSISTTTWNWGDGNTSTGATPAHTYTNTGTFTITVKAESDRGCEDSLTLTPDITVNARPVADFIYTPLDPSVLEGEVDLIDQSSADVIDWEWIIQDGSSYASQNATHNFQDSGLYNVELFVENGFGCRDSINKRIYVNADLFIHIPTSFTPNGDFLNEEFGLFGLTQGVVDMEMMIFNRWGEKVFESYSAENRWDGKYKGVDCQQGVYVYRIRFTNPNRTEWFYYNGNIELLR